MIKRVAALVRPASLEKPATASMRRAGIVIREGDISDDHEKLKKTLDGVIILISCVDWFSIDKQKGIFLAAKEVGVERVIPCDFATVGAKGVSAMRDKVRL